MSENGTGNNIKEPMSDSMLTKLMLPSLIGIILCVLFLCGTTFAWLSDTKESGRNTITAGFFDAEIVECYNKDNEAITFAPGSDTHSVSTDFSGTVTATNVVLVVKRVDGAAKGYVVAKYYEDGNVANPPTYTQVKEVVDDNEIKFEFEIGADLKPKIVIEPVLGMIQAP